MLKLFLRLYVMLAVAITAFILGLILLPNFLLQDIKAAFFQRVYQGTVYLIQKELADQPLETWPGHIQRLQPFFGYPLDLQRLEEVALTNRELSRLRKNQVVVAKVDGANYVYMRLSDSPYVLSIGNEETLSENARRVTMGTHHLLLQELAGHPQQTWPAIIQELQGAFGFPLALVRLENLPLTATERKRLYQGETLGFDKGKATERYYVPIKDTPFALQAGPVGLPFIVKAFDYLVYASLAALVAIPVLLWVRPLWRNMIELDRVTAAFGRGEFTARAVLPARSVLAALADTFNSMAERIQRLIDSHKTLTNAVSHELRTPIARLRFGIEMLGNAPDEAARARFIASMDADIEALDALVAELLTYARFDREMPSLQLHREPLGPWLKNLVAQVQEEISPVHLECSFTLEQAQWQAAFEPKLLARAIGNLLRNAGRYAQTQVAVSVALMGQDVQIQIDDDGPGIPSAARERIFEPFTRLDTSRDRSSGGYGLGLAIVKRIAEWHDGQVFVMDSPLGGARFCFRWPGSTLPTSGNTVSKQQGALVSDDV
jgi:signal transduction histidine kinase